MQLTAINQKAVTGRPGARFGPNYIRAASKRRAYGYSIYTGEKFSGLLVQQDAAILRANLIIFRIQASTLSTTGPE